MYDSRNCIYVRVLEFITGSPAGLSRVNGDGPSSAKMLKINRLPSTNYESFVFKLGKGDYVTRINNPAKFGHDRISGGAPTWW